MSRKRLTVVLQREQGQGDANHYVIDEQLGPEDTIYITFCPKFFEAITQYRLKPGRKKHVRFYVREVKANKKQGGACVNATRL